LQIAAKAFGVNLEKLPEQKSADEKVRIAAVMKAGTSVSNGWLAERLGMGVPGTVTQYVRRFHAGGGGTGRAFTAALSKVRT
jgi:hypothetical protein